MTKIEAMRQVLADNGGIASLQTIYGQIEKYKPNAKQSAKWQEGIRGVLYRDMKYGGIIRVGKALYSLNKHDESELALTLGISENTMVTEKERFVKTRTMQSKFREQLVKKLRFCPFTHITDPRLLRASHIKPWCFSTDRERIDINNGFLLSPLYDALFDQGLITFENSRELVISPTLKLDTRKKLNLTERKIDDLPVEHREEYLEFHRTKVFLNHA